MGNVSQWKYYYDSVVCSQNKIKNQSCNNLHLIKLDQDKTLDMHMTSLTIVITHPQTVFTPPLPRPRAWEAWGRL